MNAMNHYPSVTHVCMCGGEMVHKTGTVVVRVMGREIRIREAPYFECTRCGEIEYELSSNISSIAADAYRKNLTDVIWSDSIAKSGKV